MSPDAAGQIALALYALIAVVVISWQIIRCEDGPSVWLLYLIDRIYVPFFFHGRSNRRCPFPDDRGALIIANHRSPVDPLFVWLNSHLGGTRFRIRAISFMMAREYYEVPGLVGWISRSMKSIPVNRNGQDMEGTRHTLRLLKEGHLVGVFPEGQINTGEGLLPGNPGVAYLALKSKVPVYPVFIFNSPVADSMVKPFYTRTKVRVAYGEPIDLSEYHDRKPTREILQEVTDLMMDRLAELGAGSVRGCDPEPVTLRLAKSS